MVATRRSARLSQGGSETMSPPPAVPKRAPRAKKELKEVDVKPRARGRRTTRCSLSTEDALALEVKKQEENEIVESASEDKIKQETSEMEREDAGSDEMRQKNDNVDEKETVVESVQENEEMVAESTLENDAEAVNMENDAVEERKDIEQVAAIEKEEDDHVEAVKEDENAEEELDENVNMDDTPVDTEEVNEDDNAHTIDINEGIESEENVDEISASDNENKEDNHVVISVSSDNEDGTIVKSSEDEHIAMASASDNENEQEHVAMAPASSDENEEDHVSMAPASDIDEDHVEMQPASDNEDDCIAMAPDSDMENDNEPATSTKQEDIDEDDEEDLEQLVGLAVSSFKSTNEPSTTNKTSNAPSLVSNILESGVEYSNLYLKFNGKRCSQGAELIPERKLAEEAAQFKKQIVYKKKMDETNTAAHAKNVDRDRIQTSSKWFNMVSNEMTAEAKRDIQLIKLRNYLDPKRFYKSSDHKKSNLPKVFQVGTVIEGAAEFKSNRLSRKERQQTFTQEILHDQAIRSFQDGVYLSLAPLVAHLNLLPPLPVLLRTKVSILVDQIQHHYQTWSEMLSKEIYLRLARCAPHLRVVLCAYAVCTGQLEILESLLHVKVCHHALALFLDIATLCNHQLIVCKLSPLTLSNNALAIAAGKGYQWLLPHLMNHGQLLYAQAAAAAHGHLGIVVNLHQARSTSNEKITWPIYPLDKAAMNGHLTVVQYLHSMEYHATTQAMDLAATNGHFNVVAFLHLQRMDGGTTRAIDGAAANGHIHVVRFLLSHRNEGCTAMAIRGASANGHFEMVQLLCSSIHQAPQALSDAVDYAAAFGHLKIVKWLVQDQNASFSSAAITEAARCNNTEIVHFLLQTSPKITENALLAAGTKGHVKMLQLLHASAFHLPVDRIFIFSAQHGHSQVLTYLFPWLSQPRNTLPLALVEAATKGHLNVVKMLLVEYPSDIPAEAMDTAATNGHLNIVQVLHNAHGVCTVKALNGAARNGFFDIVQFLVENCIEGGTLDAWSGAACCGHLHILKYLHLHLFCNGGSYDAIVLAARMGHIKVVRYLLENDRDHAIRVGSALTEAKIHGHQAIVAYLEQILSAKGSGLSLERFIRGKARPNKFKSESSSGKRRRVEKAVLLRNYRKEKSRIDTGNDENESTGPKSFYDKFFASIKEDDDENKSHGKRKHEKEESSHKPDPLFKAKRKAQNVRDERNAKRQAIEEKIKEKESKIVQRKKRHVKLSLRTKTGQPVIKHQMKDILHKLKQNSG
ncbi:hypothetical protein THRCLA_01221 [Thraustotheca clavata]|uniref:Fcf2 pre-rRNA processing C-terminal domain-containing protein n=1 Tax=Thraustotheca clavata TaxID=74557 RepID=A0A1W0A9Q7_9STRA|nr:hypothetical protein THRCLA_01221 [Thraustotheca clavata]